MKITKKMQEEIETAYFWAGHLTKEVFLSPTRLLTFRVCGTGIPCHSQTKMELWNLKTAETMNVWFFNGFEDNKQQVLKHLRTLNLKTGKAEGDRHENSY